MIYLDNSATTRAFDSVASVVQSALTQNYFNASSPYKKALETEKAVNAAAKTVASFLNCRAEELIFTSGGTESDNTALLCAPAGSEVIVSATEHHAVLNCQRALEARGCRFRLCPVDNTGKVLPEILAGMVNENTGLVSIMHVNNETGTINDIAALTSAVKQKNPHTLFHSDGVQAFMHICANVKEMGVDLYSVSAHKLHGPKGMGVLYIKKGTPFCPYLFGGGQQQGLRSGTVNTPAADSPVRYPSPWQYQCRCAEYFKHCLLRHKSLHPTKRIGGFAPFRQGFGLYQPLKQNQPCAGCHANSPKYRGIRRAPEFWRF